MSVDFISTDQFLAAVDERRVRQLLSDTNVPLTGSLDSSEVLDELFRQAFGEVLSASFVGERYSELDLVNLAVDPNSSGGAVLRRLVSDITYALLVSRRGASAAEVDRQCPRYAIARGQLEQLRLGNRVFPGVPEAAEAGLPVTTNLLTNQNRPRLFSQEPSGRLWPFRCE